MSLKCGTAKNYIFKNVIKKAYLFIYLKLQQITTVSLWKQSHTEILTNLYNKIIFSLKQCCRETLIEILINMTKRRIQQMLMLLRILRRSHVLAWHQSKNNGGTAEGLWVDLSHFYYLGISNSWRAAPQLSI